MIALFFALACTAVQPKHIKIRNLQDEFDLAVKKLDEPSFAFTIENDTGMHTFGLFAFLDDSDLSRHVVVFDTIHVPFDLIKQTLDALPSKDWKIHFMIPMISHRPLDEKEENDIRSDESKNRKVIYFDSNGVAFKRIIMNPTIQLEKDNTCKKRSEKALEWMEKNKAWLINDFEKNSLQVEIKKDHFIGRNDLYKSTLFTDLMKSSELPQVENKHNDERVKMIKTLKKEIFGHRESLIDLEEVVYKKLNIEDNFVGNTLSDFFYLSNYPTRIENSSIQYWNGQIHHSLKDFSFQKDMRYFLEFISGDNEHPSIQNISITPYPKEFFNENISDVDLLGKLAAYTTIQRRENLPTSHTDKKVDSSTNRKQTRDPRKDSRSTNFEWSFVAAIVIVLLAH